MSPWGVAGQRRMLGITREEIVALLIEHQHSYDIDCGEDSGCSCGWGQESRIGGENGRWQDAAFAEHLASILRDEPQPVIPQHEDIARKKMEEAERSAAARAPEVFAEPRREGLVHVKGGEGGTVTVTIHRDAKVFIEGDSVTVWSRADDRQVVLVSSSYYADLLRKTLDPVDERWATRDEVPKLGGRLIDTAKYEEWNGGPREGL